MTTTTFNQNAAAFATTPEVAMSQERRSTITLAMQLIRDGKPGRAQYELARSVTRQARIAGLGTPSIVPTCPCGGRRCPA
jgi:hypothetical protein